MKGLVMAKTLDQVVDEMVVDLIEKIERFRSRVRMIVEGWPDNEEHIDRSGGLRGRQFGDSSNTTAS